MASSSQFRYTQTPSKVVHLRNLPWECVEEELIDLCKRFGKIVNTKTNVGANRNQAFVEFALVQFTDVDTALAARTALDGRSIPKYLLPEHVGSCNLRMSYSAHTDLNIKFQSHRSRDYTNPYLPVNQTAMDGSMQPALGADGKRVETQSNVLLALIENMQYAVTVDVLHTVFSAYGTVQKIAIFEKNGSTQALIQYSGT
ncbi:hypothetical protein F2Q68_00033317 [Brassica cretica]|uniref:RRM domain-containing protein n=1 Tax=Brassica cretica TaxID=69181 RepID=A0A8S9G6W2_BRACR|nr:hypothetical protein F2Q68_00033317 [Brassica cretica]